MLVHSSRYRSPVQPETLLSTMKRSRPRDSEFIARLRGIKLERRCACG
jgi:hypothetical protein